MPRPETRRPPYSGGEEAGPNVTRNLWFHTGDLGSIDEDDYLYLVGRTGDQIRRKGVNIPAMRFTGVGDAAAMAVPSELGESEVKLCVVLDGGETVLREFMRHLRAELPSEIVPRYIEVRRDLPRTAAGEVAKEDPGD